MSRQEIVIGTRGSELALAQARLVQDALQKLNPDLSLRCEIIKTSGDKHLDKSLQELGKLEKGLFTKELDQALLDGRTHISVHSLKDLPTERPKEIFQAAMLPREDWRDVLLTRHAGGIAALPKGAIIGTGSSRRVLQLLELRPDLKFFPVRGNVLTRICKLQDGKENLAGIVLAQAGLKRLGLTPDGERKILPGNLHWQIFENILPAPGQAAIAVETTSEYLESIRKINDPATMQSVSIERELLALMGGGCHLALGTIAVCCDDQVHLKAVFSPDENIALRRAEITFSLREKHAALSQLAKTLSKSL
ncbi:MAG: hydroxymethylbilane synthase [Chthoniobacterales bacterium]